MSNFKATIEDLKEIKGNVRGSCSQSMVSYLKEIGKEEYLPRIQERFKEYGFEEKLNEIISMKEYPIAFEVALIFSIKEVLNWGEKEIKELGRNVSKMSFIVKLLMKYFLSAKKSYQQAPAYWKKHFDFGELEAPEFNEKDKYFILRVKDFALHPLHYKFLEGYFETMATFVISAKKFRSEERKCTYKGHPYHEFIIKWE